MIIAKFSINIDRIFIKLCKFENKTNLPVYAIQYSRGEKENYTYIHNSISYTREQAIKIFNKFINYLYLK